MNDKRYLILAIVGALIVGLSCYLFLNSFMDRVDIVVFARDIQQGETIQTEDLTFRQHYKNGLPESYITDKSEALGKKIFVDRKKDDFVSREMLIQEDKKEFSFDLQKDEVLLALHVLEVEPVLGHLKPGQKISMVATNRDPSIVETPAYVPAAHEDRERFFVPEDYIDQNTFNLSKNILYIDGYIIIRDLEVLDLETVDSSSQNILTGTGDQRSVHIYLKCHISEAPYISALVSSENFTIIMEGAG